MTPDAEHYLSIAQQHLVDAKKIASFNIPHIAAREAYLAAYHAAEAFLSERTGKIAKTHSGLRSAFAAQIRLEPRIDPSFTTFLAKAYELKSLADYGGGAAGQITANDAVAALETADRFVACIMQILGKTSANGKTDVAG